MSASELQTRLVQILGVAQSDQSLYKKISENFPDPSAQTTVIKQITQFLGYFDMFKSLKALSKELLIIINDTFEMCEQPSEFQEILLKSILLRFTEIYIDHAGYADKDKIIKTLSQSLEILAPQALIINLGLMVKPIFSDVKYLAEQSQVEEKHVEEVDNSQIALKIKKQIDAWIKSQSLNVDDQAALTEKLGAKVSALAKELKLPEDCKEFRQIMLECTEMLNMQLTMLSLMMDLDDEDLSPQPIG
jgi:hypothetical protein